ncbi:MAG: hypothetical protein V2A34_12320 [Lentisphaerota bacterium]
MKRLWLMKTAAGAVLVAGMISGCGTLKKAYPEKRCFVLEAARTNAALPASCAGAALAVRAFTLPPVNKGAEFVYRFGGQEWTADFYHVFFISPEQLLADATEKWISASGVFGEVIPFSSRVQPGLVLEGYVTDLYGDYSDRERASAVMGIEFILLDESRAGSRILFHKTYRQRVDLAARSADLLVLGWDGALEKILEGLEIDLGQACAARAP